MNPEYFRKDKKPLNMTGSVPPDSKNKSRQNFDGFVRWPEGLYIGE